MGSSCSESCAPLPTTCTPLSVPCTPNLAPHSTGFEPGEGESWRAGGKQCFLGYAEQGCPSVHRVCASPRLMPPSSQIIPAAPVGIFPETLPYHNTLPSALPRNDSHCFCPSQGLLLFHLKSLHFGIALAKFPSPMLQLKVSVVPSSSKANESLSNFSADAP